MILLVLSALHPFEVGCQNAIKSRTTSLRRKNEIKGAGYGLDDKPAIGARADWLMTSSRPPVDPLTSPPACHTACSGPQNAKRCGKELVGK